MVRCFCLIHTLVEAVAPLLAWPSRVLCCTQVITTAIFQLVLLVPLQAWILKNKVSHALLPLRITSPFLRKDYITCPSNYSLQCRP